MQLAKKISKNYKYFLCILANFCFNPKGNIINLNKDFTLNFFLNDLQICNSLIGIMKRSFIFFYHQNAEIIGKIKTNWKEMNK